VGRGFERRKSAREGSVTVEIPDGSFKRSTPPCEENGEGTPEFLCPVVDKLSESFLRHLISFLRHLKNIGLSLSPGKTLDILKGMEWIRIESKDDLYALLSAHSISHPDDIPLFDTAFESFWALHEHENAIKGKKDEGLGQRLPEGAFEVTTSGSGRPRRGQKTFRYSAEEVLSKKDLAALAEAESEQMIKMIRELAQSVGLRVSRRWKSSGRGERLDLRRSLRCAMKSGGELVKLLRKRPMPRKTRFAVLCDVSGSMEGYSRFLLEFAHGFQKHVPRVDTFAFSTSLTHTTPFLRTAHRGYAYGRIAEKVTDWSGGTRIGSCLATFNHRYARRFPSKDTVCIVVSDGWDQGDIQLLEREIRTLKKRTRYLVWLNPLLGLPDYRPIDRGMRAALPHADDFLDCHNLEQLREFGQRLENRC
jgi:uncharacterized protein with von Willebrand factor type A (vWA) domain